MKEQRMLLCAGAIGLTFVAAVITLDHVTEAAPADTGIMQPAGTTGWRTDPAWNQGKAEWALYDAQRIIYGKPRHYEATLFTNTQHMDRSTGTKAEDWRADGAVAVFKHNLSEIVPTERYDYRFLTTGFSERSTLEPFRVVASTQEDCGATYKSLTVQGETVSAHEFCYFPGEGVVTQSDDRPGNLACHDLLSLRLRDLPFGPDLDQPWNMTLVGDQTDTHRTLVEGGSISCAPAFAEHVGIESVSVPFGDVRAHHVVVHHTLAGGVTESHYWFSAETGHRRVMVRYSGPWGVEYRLKRLEWWAYWSEKKPEEAR